VTRKLKEARARYASPFYKVSLSDFFGGISTHLSQRVGLPGTSCLHQVGGEIKEAPSLAELFYSTPTQLPLKRPAIASSYMVLLLFLPLNSSYDLRANLIVLYIALTFSRTTNSISASAAERSRAHLHRNNTFVAHRSDHSVGVVGKWSEMTCWDTSNLLVN
jgi:hypothetical protein